MRGSSLLPGANRGLHRGIFMRPVAHKPMKPPSEVESPQSRWKMGRVVLQRETAHRGGKTVIVVKDFASHLPQSVIETIGKRLRSACGCGGTVKEKRIE